MNSTQERILSALRRMWKRGHEHTEHYQNLRRKYLIAARNPETRDVTADCLRSIGNLIARLTKETGLRRGDLQCHHQNI